MIYVNDSLWLLVLHIYYNFTKREIKKRGYVVLYHEYRTRPDKIFYHKNGNGAAVITRGFES